MSLKNKAISGLAWTFIDTFLIKGMLFIVMIYIARVIGPKEFGLFGMISVFIGIGKTLVDSGMTSSLIRDEKANSEDYSTVLFTNLIVSIFIYLLILASSGLVANFFNQAIIADLIKVYCIVFIISAFSSVHLTIFNKELNFKSIALVNLPSTLIGVVLGVVLANYEYGVWSIVWLYIIIEFIKTLLFIIISPWKPKFEFSKRKLVKHFNFGYKLMLSGVLNHVFLNIYNILIGRFFSPATLGYFERAKQFNDYPSLTLSGIISRVTYPLLVKVKSDKNKLREVFRKFQSFTFFIIAPLMICLAAIAEPLFELFLGEEWIPAVPFFQVLTFASIFLPIHSFNLIILNVFGRSDLFLKLEVYKKIISLIVILITFQFGLMALIWSGVIISILALFINTLYTSKMINYSPINQMKDLAPILIFSIISFLLAFLVSLYIRDYLNNFTQTLFITFFGSFIYLFISFVDKKNPVYYSMKLINSIKR